MRTPERMRTVKEKMLKIIAGEAVEVLAAINGENEFYSLEEAQARLNAVINVALALELLTEEEITKVKKDERVRYYEQ